MVEEATEGSRVKVAATRGALTLEGIAGQVCKEPQISIKRFEIARETKTFEETNMGGRAF